MSELGFLSFPRDPSLFVKLENGNTVRALIIHVDDFLIAGEDAAVSDATSDLKAKFRIGMQTNLTLKFTGLSIMKID